MGGNVQLCYADSGYVQKVMQYHIISYYIIIAICVS